MSNIKKVAAKVKKSFATDSTFQPYKRKNPTLKGQKRTTTKGFVDRTKYGSHIVRTAAIEHPQRKGHYRYSYSVNGRTSSKDEGSKAHKHLVAKHVIGKLF